MSGNICRAAMVETDITPDFEVELIGGWWPEEGPRTSACLDRLSSQALVVEDGGARYCLISIDSLGLTQRISADLRACVARKLDTQPEHVMISFTHTHEAPAPISPVNGERYREMLFSRVVECVGRANAALRPARAAWALTKCPCGENRREGCNAVDDRLGILKFLDADDGSAIGAVMRLTAHANILMRGVNGHTVMSSDFIGRARAGVSEYFKCPVLVVQGAAGNVKPVGVDKAAGGSADDVRRLAGIIVASAKNAAFAAPVPIAPSAYSVPLRFASDVPDAQEARRIADDGLRICGAQGDMWLEKCAALRESGIDVIYGDGEMQFLYLAGGCLCGVPYEIFCELAMEAEKRLGEPLMFLNGYTNGCEGYLPNGAEWDKGGFETLYSYFSFFRFYDRVMPFRRDTAEKLVDAACDGYAKHNV